MSNARLSKPMSESRISMMEIVMPEHANGLGNVFGGRVMALIDIAGAMSAMRHCRIPVVTASIDRLDFKAPIRVSEFIILHANVNYAGRTSMEVGVKVVGEHPLTGEQRHTCTAYLTYVAVNPATGQPTEIPDVVPETDEEREWYTAAKLRRARRLAQAKGE
jgi:acyl-CoA hydrolase